MKRLLFLICFVCSACSFSSVSKESSESSKVIIHSSNGPIEVIVEIADTSVLRSQGLMFRDYLDRHHGMLFVFDKEQEVSFWMKNTYIPLDMIFVDANSHIVHIEKNVPPCKTESCPLYSSLQKVQFVIETNAGFCDAYSVEIGNTILLPQ